MLHRRSFSKYVYVVIIWRLCLCWFSCFCRLLLGIPLLILVSPFVVCQNPRFTAVCIFYSSIYIYILTVYNRACDLSLGAEQVKQSYVVVLFTFSTYPQYCNILRHVENVGDIFP